MQLGASAPPKGRRWGTFPFVARVASRYLQFGGRGSVRGTEMRCGVAGWPLGNLAWRALACGMPSCGRPTLQRALRAFCMP